ncbi:MT-A70-domain-containing protein [Rickenella mellea]|uniref:MT-A70-domain-containing protein n=1 Tax=Rickenella mellea TaxID=50990 RepID=A0A4Y7QJI1_9AGAM|nr:MT-A70-domain-containing protein [Rickenella mellea]
MATTTAQVLSSANETLAAHASLIARVRASQKSHRRQLRQLASPPHEILRLPLIPSPPPSPPLPPSSPLPPNPAQKPVRQDLPPAKRARVARYANYVPEEETIRNDYSQHYVDSGDWPQNWVLGAEPERRFEEYPKQQRLLALKKAAVNEAALPAAYLTISQLSDVNPLKFDVILIDPPFSTSFNWDDLEKLPIPSLAADPSFIFLWVGSGAGEGLERGREVLGRWGYRRCEDVVWVKTNKELNRGPGTDPPTSSLLTRTKQHCLIGIRGTVRRSTDNWFVHCNIDTDTIIWEGDPADPTRKPPEMYTLIENFCLGTRRMEIFGRAHSLRRGWVTVTSEDLKLTPDEYRERDQAAPIDKETWDVKIKEMAQGGRCVVPNTPDIENLRPKSPVGRGSSSTGGGTGGPGGQQHRHQQPMGTGMNMMGPMGNTGPQNFNPMMAQPMNMMNMGMGGIPNVGNMGWQMGNLGGAGGMNMAPQNNFGFGGFDGGQGMMGVGVGPMGMNMAPQGGFGYGFEPGQAGVGVGFGPQGGGGMWMGDFAGAQPGQYMGPGMWDGSGDGMFSMNNLDTSQWGGGYQQ